MPPASATAVNNNGNHNNTTAAKAEREEKLRSALKAFILKDRQRKREEFEAKIEEERLRKEREARERQNDMTLEETRGQIAKLDKKIEELQKQKSQLFLELKKVLNEDNNRKKEQREKDYEMHAMQTLQSQQSNVAPALSFIPAGRLQHHHMPILAKPMGNQPVKRGRSPSPPSHQGYYKNTNYPQSKHDDNRRTADYARVLWNKPPSQYQNPGTLFYQTISNAPTAQAPQDTRGLTLPYSAYNLPLRPMAALQPPVTKGDVQKPAQIYHLDQTTISQGNSNAGSGSGQKTQVTMEKIERYHVDVKHDGPSGHGASQHQLPEGVVYTSLITGMGAHPNVLQISPNPQQNQKPTSSITQNYVPGRGHTSSHEQQIVRQQQISVMQGQPGQQQQPMHYQRRLY